MSRESHLDTTSSRKRSKTTPLQPDVLEAFLKKATQLHGDGRFDEAARFYQHVHRTTAILKRWRRPIFTP